MITCQNAVKFKTFVIIIVLYMRRGRRNTFLHDAITFIIIFVNIFNWELS